MYTFESPEALRTWLTKHHLEERELVLKYYKKHTKKPSITWEESVDEALCFGWIDGIRHRLDDEAYTIRFTPRNKKSVWSKRNIERVQQLIRENRMQPEGFTAYQYKDQHPDSGY